MWIFAQGDSPPPLTDATWLTSQLATLWNSRYADDVPDKPRIAVKRQQKFLRVLDSPGRPRRHPVKPGFSVPRIQKALGRLVARFADVEVGIAAAWLDERMPDLAIWRDFALFRTGSPVILPLDRARRINPSAVGPGDSPDLARRLRDEKLASLKRLAYGASHEINNPLANIASRAQTLLRDEPDPERRKKLASINHQAFRAHEMIADMMLFAHPPKPDFAMVDLGELCKIVLDELSSIAAEQGTMLAAETGDSLSITADATQLAVALKALVRNSLESLGEGGEIRVSATETAERVVEISVTDDGPGFAPEQVEHVFDPFFSGREAGRGLGFGLSKAWRIADMHGGSMIAENLPNGGACVRIQLLAGQLAARGPSF